MAGGQPLALTDEEIYRNFQFNFINPGARALGIGGAFIALADDPTTAQANPAGLDLLREPNFYFEYRVANLDDDTFSSDLGSLSVDPNTGARDLPFLGLSSGTETGSLSAPTFISFSYPFQLGAAGRRLTLAGSRFVHLDQDRSLPSSGGTGATFSFDSFPLTVNGNNVESYAIQSVVQGDSSIQIVSYDAAVGIELHKDFSAGLILSYATLDVEADTLTQVIDPQGVIVTPGNPRLPSQPDADIYTTSANDSDSDFTYTVGLHWHPDSIYATGVSPWRVGAVYRRGARFSVDESAFLNGVQVQQLENRIVVPDRFALGLSYAFLERWLVVSEFERVEYSDQLDGFQAGVNYLTSAGVAGGQLGISAPDDIEFEVDDGNIIRAGVEYVMPVGSSGNKLALRGGWYHTPDSRIRMTGFQSGDDDVNDTYLDAFPGGEEDDHITAGVGFTLGRSLFSLGAETSDLGTQFVGSYTLALEKVKQ
ncbi:MAG: OmpP1/FadL family transporter [Candidatus Polarisedimenticolia bacterium]